MRFISALSLFLLGGFAFADDSTKLEKGTAHFRLVGNQDGIPERYRLAEHTFDYEMEPKLELSSTGVTVWHVRFPSPVTTEQKENNTVHAEYYRPKGKGPFPCVIVLDIMGGTESLSRLIASQLAQNKIGGLFVYMPYYGPRRPNGSSLRLISPDVKQSLDGIKQTVLDLRCATAWMESRPEIDSKRLGILGTSVGSFMGALTAEMEPKLSRVAILLGGGGLVEAYYDHPEAKTARKLWEAIGGTKEKLAKVIAPVDPITCAENLKDRKVLMIAAKKDEIVPPKAAEALWKAAGKPKIVWYDAGHYTAAIYIIPAMELVVEHFGAKE